jgi:hypothetical protein
MSKWKKEELKNQLIINTTEKEKTMKHWTTKEEMGKGFQHTEKQHEKFDYNSLIEVKTHEKNLMRTFYLIRDIWSDKQMLELRSFIDEQMEERGIKKPTNN